MQGRALARAAGEGVKWCEWRLLESAMACGLFHLVSGALEAWADPNVKTYDLYANTLLMRATCHWQY